MKKEFINISEAEELSQIPRKTWYQWIEKKIITGHSQDGKKKKFLKRDDVLRVMVERKLSGGNETAPKVVAEEKIPVFNSLTTAPAAKKVSREMTKADAESVIKVEDAIKKHRENLLLEGKLLIVDEFLPALQDFLAQAFDQQRELIERWSIEWRLTSDQLQRAQSEYNLSLRNVLSGIRKKVFDNEPRAAKGVVGDFGSGAEGK